MSEVLKSNIRKIVVSYGRKSCVNYQTRELHISEELEFPANADEEGILDLRDEAFDEISAFVDQEINKHK